MGDATYKNKNEESELNDIKNQFEGERRKSMSIEQTAAQLQKEHKSLTNELEELREELKSN
jgi:predicted  nucleic acid-binding Zn-ribbon protein